MNRTPYPPTALRTALIANGREPAPVKRVLAPDWAMIDERDPSARRIECDCPPHGIEPARVVPAPSAAFALAARDAATAGGWLITEREDNTSLIEIAGQRRAQVRIIEVTDRGPALAVVACAGELDDPLPVASFALSLTAKIRMVRASLVEFPDQSRLIWEVPFLRPVPRAAELIDALSCLTLAVLHGQHEIQLLARDPRFASRWLTFPSP